MYRHFVKPILDFIGALFAILLLLLLFIVIAILVRIKLGSPVIFKQKRPGKDGKLFTLYKFRSMTNAADKNGNLLSDEERLTKFGRFLRRTSIDELTELFDILLCKMSFIGPRPFLVKDYVFFDEETKKRQSVRPGLSGLAQVNGRNNISWEQKFEYDLKYAKKVTFAGDFVIFWKSIFEIFKRKNINRDGFATDEDYGDYLLRTNQISCEEYSSKIEKAKEIIKQNGRS